MSQLLPDEFQWISLRDAMDVWRNGTGKGVKIAILDSGVELSHPALQGLTLVDDLAVTEQDESIVVTESKGCDLYGHGTAIAYVISQTAPDAEIGSFRVLGDGLAGKGDLVRKGVSLAIERGYQVLNCSFGFSGRGYLGKLRGVDRHKEWIDDAYLKGIHLVSACNNYDYDRTEWPGHFATSISVDKTSCEPDDFFYRPGSLIEFAAKGYSLRLPWKGGGWENVTGSSYAAPRVAAWVARLISVYPNLSPPQLKGLLRHIALERPHVGLHGYDD